MTNCILIDRNNPTNTISAFDMSKCFQGHVELCIIPDESRKYLEPYTKAKIIGSYVYARGVNSSFYPVELEDSLKTKVYVHESYIIRT